MQCKCGGDTRQKKSTKDKKVAEIWEECSACGRVFNRRTPKVRVLYVTASCETGHRAGQDHPKAKLTDSEVDDIRAMREEEAMKIKDIAEKLSLPYATVKAICNYQRRAGRTRLRRVEIHE